jgi:hypothetical protein
MELASIAVALVAMAAAEKRVAVLETKVEGGVEPVVGKQFTSRLAEVLGRRPAVKVLAPDDIRAVLEQEAHRQLLGCADDRCIAEIGGALGVDLLVSGRVSKLQDGYALSLSGVDPASVRAVGHVTETWRGPTLELLDLVSPMVDKLLAGDERLTGALALEGVVVGSRILVDDQIRGTAPAGRMAGLDIGARRVQVIADEHAPFERWIVIRKDETTTFAVVQVADSVKPVYQTWWFWTVVGVAVVGGATGAAFALRPGDDNATGVNVSVNANEAFGGAP